MLRLLNSFGDRSPGRPSSGGSQVLVVGLVLGFALVHLSDASTRNDPESLPPTPWAVSYEPVAHPLPDASHRSTPVTFAHFADALLTDLDAPLVDANRSFLILWMRAESGTSSKVRNNPLNTSWRTAGSTTFNDHGVQHYPDIATGLRATASTLQLDYYKALLSQLRSGRATPSRLARELARSPWGTGDLVADLIAAGVDPAASAHLVITGTP